ncbi:DUF6786 family protein [Chitinophaga japonensis]|nr:DUF6786 family protein [Chitinophaga japonensis]
MRYPILCCTLALGSLFACRPGGKKAADTTMTDTATFEQDVNFLRQHLDNVVLLQSAADSSMVLVTGDYQARVMTSSARGMNGKSYGWINYPLIASGEYQPHINAYGGEERCWLGPEGGQYGLFFPPGKPFEFEHWQTPGLIDTAAFTMVSQSDTEVVYTKEGALQNYAGTVFKVGIERKVQLLDKAEAARQMGVQLPDGLSVVAYRTENKLTNTGTEAWQERSGLPSIWLLGMFTPSDKTVIVVPFRQQDNAREFIHDDYFGKIPPERLQVRDGLVLMKADGRARGKIGLEPAIAKPMAGSVDTESGAITLILFSISPAGRYVNSRWEQQAAPYKGDVVNCYNDGPLADGSQMGPFYELESSSDARPLLPGDSMTYRQTTVHLEGSRTALDALAQELWQLSIADIAAVFNKQ